MERFLKWVLGFGVATAIVVGLLAFWEAAMPESNNLPPVEHGVVVDKYHSVGRYGDMYYRLVIRQCESPTAATCLQEPVKVDKDVWSALRVGDSYPIGYEDPAAATLMPTTTAEESAPVSEGP